MRFIHNFRTRKMLIQSKKIFLYTIILLMTLLSFVYATDIDIQNPKKMTWSFDGIAGTFDRAAIQRGFQVYKEVCSACHSINKVAFRNLAEVGFSEDEVKYLAHEYKIQDGPNDDGEMFERDGKPSDIIPSPYSNEKAARASNNGSYPPDLSLIIKARTNGADYVYSLLTGYTAKPKDFHVDENMHYNPYFAGGGQQLSMPAPLINDGQVHYIDNTEATVEQMAKDVVNFLQWAAEPEMEKRKNLGISVIFFTFFMTILFFMAKKHIWKNVK